MTVTDPVSTNSLGEPEAVPQQTDNGPKEGDADVDQESVELPSAGEHEGAGLADAVLAAAMSHRGTIESPPGSDAMRDERAQNPSDPHSIQDYLSDPDVAAAVIDAFQASEG